MIELPKPRLTEYRFDGYTITRRQDQCVFDVFKERGGLPGRVFVQSFDTYEAAVLSFAKEV